MYIYIYRERENDSCSPRKPTGSLLCYYGNLLELMGECNLGVLYSGSLLAWSTMDCLILVSAEWIELELV